MARVLVPGGQLMIYVWAMEQKNRRFEKQDVLVPWNRALCSRLLSEPSQSGGSRQCGPPDSSRACRPPCPGAPGPACAKEPCDSTRSPSSDPAPATARACCGNASQEGQRGDGFYGALGKSFRAWFSSRSLDEPARRKRAERGRPWSAPGAWGSGPVSIQPSRRCSAGVEPREPSPPAEPDVDEEGFVGNSSRPRVEGWLRAPGIPQPRGEDHGGESERNGAGGLPRHSHTSGNGVDTGKHLEDGVSPARETRTRTGTPAVSSAGPTPEGAGAVGAQPPELRDPGRLRDPGAFMRYYHVFRAGELGELLRGLAGELRVLRSGRDHGNWCLVAEKTGRDPGD